MDRLSDCRYQFSPLFLHDFSDFNYENLHILFISCLWIPMLTSIRNPPTQAVSYASFTITPERRPMSSSIEGILLIEVIPDFSAKFEPSRHS